MNRSRAVSALGALLASLATLGCDDGGSSPASAGSRSEERPGGDQRAGRWDPLPEPPGRAIKGPVRASGPERASADRAGRYLVTLAGVDYDQATVKGLVLDLRSREWKAAAPSGLWWRYGHSTVAAGEQVILWGGCCGPAGRGSRAQGASYEPAADRWRPLPDSPIRGRHEHSAVWTGAEMIVWGGTASSPGGGRPGAQTAAGAAYEPSSRSWRTIAPAPIGRRSCHAAVWSGDEMIVWGGTPSGCGSGARRWLAGGAAYDPARDRWRRIAPAPIPSGFGSEHMGPSAVWAGTEMIVWNGFSAAAYRPAADRWRRLPITPKASRADIEPGAMLWTGREIFVSGGCCPATPPVGCCPAGYFSASAAYDPRRDEWSALPPSPILGKRYAFAARAGKTLVARSGRAAALYRPPRQLLQATAPAARAVPPVTLGDIVGEVGITRRSRVDWREQD